ncbi:MAG: hypothetical protein ACI308_04725 [Muribaculaceae bacterium]
MEKVVVNDTNIFIDLFSIGLIDELFKLPFSVHTVDLVLEEITNNQHKRMLQQFIDEGLLKIGSIKGDEFDTIIKLQSSAGGNVSFVDCAVWHYAEKNNYTLLTGDRQLKNKALSHNVTVKGIIYLFDEFIRCKVLEPRCVAIKLKELLDINQRLPKRIIQERIDKWCNL